MAKIKKNEDISKMTLLFKFGEDMRQLFTKYELPTFLWTCCISWCYRGIDCVWFPIHLVLLRCEGYLFNVEVEVVTVSKHKDLYQTMEKLLRLGLKYSSLKKVNN